MTTTATGRLTAADRLFGRAAEAVPTAPPDAPDVVQAASQLGIPPREIEGVRDHAQGTIVDCAGASYILLRHGEADALGQAGTLVYDPDGVAPRLAMPRFMSERELSSGPWSGASFADVAAEALGIHCPLGELRSGEQVIDWIAGDPPKAASFWAASARAADQPAAQHAHINAMAGWARALIVKAGVLDVP